jgi:hypothetical protein
LTAIADKSADDVVGAEEWASGNHTCSGNKAALIPRPTIKKEAERYTAWG